MSLAAIQKVVDDLVRDTSQVITSESRDQAIADALLRYSGDAPRRIVADLATQADGSLAVPSDWLPESTILAVEWPIGRRPVAYIPPSAVEPYVAPEGVVLLLNFGADIGVGALVRLTFTGGHTVDSVPNQHRLAVCSLAAANLCGQLAAHYANESEPVISADTVDHGSKTERWRKRQRDLTAAYTDVVAPAPTERTKPASADAELPRRNSLGYRPMFHPPTNWPRS